MNSTQVSPYSLSDAFAGDAPSPHTAGQSVRRADPMADYYKHIQKLTTALGVSAIALYAISLVNLNHGLSSMISFATPLLQKGAVNAIGFASQAMVKALYLPQPVYFGTLVFSLVVYFIIEKGNSLSHQGRELPSVQQDAEVVAESDDEE